MSGRIHEMKPENNTSLWPWVVATVGAFNLVVAALGALSPTGGDPSAHYLPIIASALIACALLLLAIFSKITGM